MMHKNMEESSTKHRDNDELPPLPPEDECLFLEDIKIKYFSASLNEIVQLARDLYGWGETEETRDINSMTIAQAIDQIAVLYFDSACAGMIKQILNPMAKKHEGKDLTSEEYEKVLEDVKKWTDDDEKTIQMLLNFLRYLLPVEVYRAMSFILKRETWLVLLSDKEKFNTFQAKAHKVRQFTEKLYAITSFEELNQ